MLGLEREDHPHVINFDDQTGQAVSITRHQDVVDVGPDPLQQSLAPGPGLVNGSSATVASNGDPAREADALLSPIALPVICPGSCSPAVTAAKANAELQTYVRRARLCLGTPVLPPPKVQRPTSSPVPRWSVRLATKAAKARKLLPEGQHTQVMLARHLGFTQDPSVAVTKFKELFDAKLSREHIAALAALLRIPVPASSPSEPPETSVMVAVVEHATPPSLPAF